MKQQPGKPQDLSDVTIQSERLMLRPVSPEDNEDILCEFNDNVTKYMTRGPNESLESVNEVINRWHQETKNGEKVQLAVTDKDGNFLGLTSIEKASTKTPEFGLWLKESAQGKGLGPELITALYTWASDNLNVDYFGYRADSENIGSWKIGERLVAEYGGEYCGEKTEIIREQERKTRYYHILPKTL